LKSGFGQTLTEAVDVLIISSARNSERSSTGLQRKHWPLPTAGGSANGSFASSADPLRNRKDDRFALRTPFD
jgi:hypothetical protein